MKLSKFTQQNYNLFMSKFYNCIKNNKKNNLDISLFNKLFLDIKKSYDFINFNLPETLYSKEIIKDISLPVLYNNNFFPINIRNYILSNTKYKIKYNCVLNNRKITIIFFVYTNTINISDENIKYILIMLNMLFKYSSNKCSKELTINIYLTPFKRLLPNSRNIILDAINVNGGFTTTCDVKSEIVVFRKEEWFKVLIHECFHNLGLDFSNMNLKVFNENIHHLFPINSKFNLFESYCEFWARIINCSICSFISLDNKNDIERFNNNLYFSLEMEKIFSLYQCNKILEFIGIEYDNLYKLDNMSIFMRDNLYKEKTNIFAYYIITYLLINNYEKFLSWCNTHNIELLKFKPTQQNLNEYFAFIKNIALQKNIKNDFQNIKLLNSKNKNFIKEYNNNILKTTRMTIIEMFN
jgi:hypothetical protein